ncbi:hypothetical protein [Xanthomonas hortorum]|nr:hypothetical protein [Xanthomonas hortorum]MCM5523824.1 hypothetical protein [Xanthomonas hortorum pv. pelargonii]MCM5536333.1 hypothetical protein [Xanthomonas hortorum pv. pelargonii]MCM5541634.1 hypothetical protein [Xanthomonas hortorum pv. pelargonii]MCM5543933.1 hypothetical protein [Xanthomonas hortorum pv. pelargonii]MCM5563122.1 hypothetical protein [Xanthomonas hortorum pv. pelargonii]
MPRFTVKRFCRFALAAAVTGLAACGAASEQATPSPAISQEAAALRTVVPLTRPVALDKAGTVADVEFDLPPPGPGASSLLKVAIRLQANEGAALRAPSDRLVDEGLAARVNLRNLANGESTQIPLYRIGPAPGTDVPIGADGRVAGVTWSGVDESMLRRVGLIQQGMFYKVLLLAEAHRPAPGHYRLTLELLEDHPRLKGQSVELLLAYASKAK